MPADARARLAQVELAQQLLDAYAVMPGDALQDALEGLGADRIVQRDDLMVLAAFSCRDAHVRAALTHPLVTQPAKRRDERGAAHVAREPQATSTSSRTKCSRMRRGRSMASSK